MPIFTEDMRILIIHNSYQHRGGEDVVFEQEVSALSENNEVFVYNPKNKKKINGLISYLLYPFNFIESYRILKKIDHFRPDLIHIHNIHYSIGPWFIRVLKKKNIKMIMTLHNFRLICPSAKLFVNNKIFTKSIFEKFPWHAIKSRALDSSFIKTFITGFTYWLHNKLGTWRMISKYIILTEFNKRIFLQSTLEICENQLVVKPNFVPFTSKNHVAGIRQKHYLFIGRISEEKGLEPLIKSFLQNKKILKIAGTGPLEHDLKLKTRNVNNIIWLGNLNKDQINEQLSTSQALIVPSVCYEGAVPLTIIEGFSSHTPVITSNIGSIPEVILPEKTGWLFEPNNSDSIQKTIEEFEKSTNKSIIVERAYQYFLRNFTEEISMKTLLQIYQKTIQE